MQLRHISKARVKASYQGHLQTSLILYRCLLCDTGISLTYYDTAKILYKILYRGNAQMAINCTSDLTLCQAKSGYGREECTLKAIFLPTKTVPYQANNVQHIQLQVSQPKQLDDRIQLNKQINRANSIIYKMQPPVLPAQNDSNINSMLMISREKEIYRRFAQSSKNPSHFKQTLASYCRHYQDIEFKYIESVVPILNSTERGDQDVHSVLLPDLIICELLEPIGVFGTIKARVCICTEDGESRGFATNHDVKSTLPPLNWSDIRVKLEMSRAFERKAFADGVWKGESSGVKFRFLPPISHFPKWRGFPVYE